MDIPPKEACNCWCGTKYVEGMTAASKQLNNNQVLIAFGGWETCGNKRGER